MNYLLLLIGFFLLIKGADVFVTGSSNIAKKFGISELIIGLTIISIGTSAPELAVSISASLAGSNEIAISNIVGSNIFNLLVVIGTCAIINPIAVDKNIIRKDYPFLILVSICLAVMVADVFLDHSPTNVLSTSDGIILLLFLALFLYKIVLDSTTTTPPVKGINEPETTPISIPKSLFFIVIGVVSIVFGGNIVVDSASKIAASFGISETVIGLTVVAMGTSLPELVTSVVASMKGNNDMALGNVVGSNIFNIILILGVSSSLHPITLTPQGQTDTLIMVSVSIIIFLFVYTGKKVTKSEGIACIATFLGYTYYILVR